MKLNFSKEFKVNQYISLKLENNKTEIYVNDKRFIQCKNLFLNIDKDNYYYFDEMYSIDEAEGIYKEFLNKDSIYEIGNPLSKRSTLEHNLTFEQEFWAHCSNIQAWVESGYDTRLLHRTISFPLMKRLTELGDLKARKVFKEEIVKRVLNGNENVRHFLIDEGYLKHLDQDEYLYLFNDQEAKTVIDLEKEVGRELELLTNYNQEDEYPAFWCRLIDKEFRITGITIENCGVNKIPDTIGNLKLLEFLNLGNNNIKELPESISNLDKLKFLHLANNKIDSIPQTIGKMKSLEVLNLNSNNLSTLPNSLGKLKNLKELALNENFITDLSNLARLNSLKKLNILNNPINPSKIYTLKQQLTSLNQVIINGIIYKKKK